MSGKQPLNKVTGVGELLEYDCSKYHAVSVHKLEDQRLAASIQETAACLTDETRLPPAKWKGNIRRTQT
jgi:hypothetical protein